MNPGNTYPPYSAADIMRYLQGDMPAAEMRQLELRALEDPFLQDAIDGYSEALESGDKEAILPYMNEALAYPGEQTKDSRAIVVPFWQRPIFKYAAVALLVGGAGWGIFSLTQQVNTKQELAIVTDSVKNEPVTDSTFAKRTPPKNDVAANANQLPSTGLITEPQDNIAPANTDTYKIADAKKLESDDNTLHAATAEPQNQIKTLSRNVASAGIPAPATPAESTVVQKPDADLSLSKKLSGNAAGVALSRVVTEDLKTKRLLSGRTMDTDKYPLDNIVVRVKGTDAATVSDELGRFQLALPDSTTTLIASGPGYKTKEFTTSGKAEKVELQLEPSASASLQEVVVTGYSTRRKSAAKSRLVENKDAVKQPVVLDMDTTDAAPVGGWNNFTKYVSQNKQVKSASGKVLVILSIEIDENGRPGNMDIIQSGGKEYNSEAFRLLKAGPAWINKTKEPTAFAKITIVL